MSRPLHHRDDAGPEPPDWGDDGVRSTDPEFDATGFTDPLEDFLVDRARGRSSTSGSYRRNLEWSVGVFADWFAVTRGRPPTVESVDDADFREFARALRAGSVDGLDTDDPARGSVLTVYANVSAYVGWLVDEGILDEHVAQTDRATGPLPADDGRRSGDQQAWSSEQRELLLDHVADVVARTEDDDWSVLRAVRDRALVSVVAYTGIRGGELLAHPEDDRRSGLRWRDVDVDDGHLTVLSKKRSESWSDRALPPQAVGPVEALRSVLAPPADDWPVFPSMHRPTLYERIRPAMAAGDVGADRIESRLRNEGTFDLCRSFDVVPPSLSTSGARSVMRRLTREAGIEVADDHGYLTLHGARRGAGEVMVREHGYAAAARLLDNTERMVRERYSHIEAGEFADDVGDAFASQDPDGG